VFGTAELVALVGCSDLEASARFYGGVLGLELLESSSFANVFDANGTMLRVTLVNEVTEAPYTVLGWRVPDIAAAIKALSAKGVSFRRYQGIEQDEYGVWVAPGGSRIAWFKDPDGNTLSLQQAPPA
jgi:catechol 2,3-dioxygenase-like lactoylglutathione lyase family enzyme